MLNLPLLLNALLLNALTEQRLRAVSVRFQRCAQPKKIL